MGIHNHVWRSESSPAAQVSKEKLIAVIMHAGHQGRWLRDAELQWGKELEQDGIVTLCCEGKAATIR